MNTEVVYSGRDNTIDLELRADGVAVDLSPVQRTVLELTSGAGVTTVDSDTAPTAFSWGAVVGRLALTLGHEGIAAGNYKARLIVVDASNPNGVVWGAGFYLEVYD